MVSPAFFILVSLCLGSSWAAENPVTIPNPLMYQSPEFDPATLGLTCTQQGFVLDFKQFEGAKGATLTLGDTNNEECSYTYPANDQLVRFPQNLNFDNFKKCGATITTDQTPENKVTAKNRIKIVQQYSGPTDQKFNWITCAQYDLSCCFVPGQPDIGISNTTIDEISLCDNDDNFLFTVWFVPLEDTLYWHQYVNGISPLYGVVPDTCFGLGTNKRGEKFRIELVRGGCVVDDPRMRMSIEKQTDGSQLFLLTTENEQLYSGITVQLQCSNKRCAHDNVPQNDNNARCSTFWEDEKLKSCSAPGTPLAPAPFSVKISPKSTTRMTCNKALA